MESLSVKLDSGSDYSVHFDAIDQLGSLLSEHLPQAGRCFLITDRNVQTFYLERVQDTIESAGFTVRAIVLPAGERAKSAAMLHHLYDEMLESGVDRRTPVIALGGGVVGDLAGYAAATLLRGIPLVHLPTSLVAQVDSSIGGKTGINHAVGKNLIGSFYQPAFVLADVNLMETLPDREWYSGLAELLKHALIDSREHVSEVRNDWAALLDREARTIERSVPRSAAVKVQIVSEDLHEAGKRAFLNFGHTYAHAIERVAGYGQFSHGEAVALGMTAALHLSAQLHPNFDPGPAEELTSSIPLQSDPANLPADALYQAMIHDKKNRDGKRRFVALSELGSPTLVTCDDAGILADSWHLACNAFATQSTGVLRSP